MFFTYLFGFSHHASTQQHSRTPNRSATMAILPIFHSQYIHLLSDLICDCNCSGLFASVLQDMGFRDPEGKFKCDTGTNYKIGGATAFGAELADNCVIMFVDEVYNLEPFNDKEGTNITMMIMKDAYERRHELSFIVAGYKGKVEKQWFAFNEGLPGRFPGNETAI